MKEVKSARAGLVCVNNYHMTSKLSTLHVTSEWANISCERSPYCSLNVGIRMLLFYYKLLTSFQHSGYTVLIMMLVRHQ